MGTDEFAEVGLKSQRKSMTNIVLNFDQILQVGDMVTSTSEHYASYDIGHTIWLGPVESCDEYTASGKLCKDEVALVIDIKIYSKFASEARIVTGAGNIGWIDTNYLKKVSCAPRN